MATIKIGLDTTSLSMGARPSLRLAADLRLDAVELDGRGEFAPSRLSQTAIREIRKTLNDHRLQVSALSFRTRGGYDTTDQLDARIAGTKAAMELAGQLGAPVVVNYIGRIPDSDDTPAWSLLVDVLTELGGHGQRTGALLAAETGPDPPEAWRRLLSSLPDQHLLLDLNPGRLLASGQSAAEFAAEFASFVGHVHATDGVYDPLRRSGQAVPVGHGAADFPALLGALAEGGYRGPLTLQCSGRFDAREELGEAAAFLRKT